MALGSKASEERRRKAREAARLEKRQQLSAVEREVMDIMASLSPTEHDRRALKLETYVMQAKRMFAPTPDNVERININILRIAEGKEPLEYRVARVPRDEIRGIRKRRFDLPDDEG